LNGHLHGLEIVSVNKKSNLKGSVWFALPDTKKFDIPEESFKSFTLEKKFGYCYANYPHVGTHIFEMFCSNDTDAKDEDVLPMHKISGDSYLWFGKDYKKLSALFRWILIWRWFYKNKIDKIVNMKWGDPHLAIGWLPVAKITNKISKEELIGLRRLEKIEINS
jgi:hypothetical protein